VLPGLAHGRLTPTNCDDLLFDDVLWVRNARRDHFDFMDKMRDRDVEVVELHNLLTETMEIPDAKAWLLDRKIVAMKSVSGWSTTPGDSLTRCSRAGYSSF
jgi:arginine deiminase